MDDKPETPEAPSLMDEATNTARTHMNESLNRTEVLGDSPHYQELQRQAGLPMDSNRTLGEIRALPGGDTMVERGVRDQGFWGQAGYYGGRALDVAESGVRGLTNASRFLWGLDPIEGGGSTTDSFSVDLDPNQGVIVDLVEEFPDDMLTSGGAVNIDFIKEKLSERFSPEQVDRIVNDPEGAFTPDNIRGLMTESLAGRGSAEQAYIIRMFADNEFVEGVGASTQQAVANAVRETVLSPEMMGGWGNMINYWVSKILGMFNPEWGTFAQETEANTVSTRLPAALSDSLRTETDNRLAQASEGQKKLFEADRLTMIMSKQLRVPELMQHAESLNLDTGLTAGDVARERLHGYFGEELTGMAVDMLVDQDAEYQQTEASLSGLEAQAQRLEDEIEALGSDPGTREERQALFSDMMAVRRDRDMLEEQLTQSREGLLVRNQGSIVFNGTRAMALNGDPDRAQEIAARFEQEATQQLMATGAFDRDPRLTDIFTRMNSGHQISEDDHRYFYEQGSIAASGTQLERNSKNVKRSFARLHMAMMDLNNS